MAARDVHIDNHDDDDGDSGGDDDDEVASRRQVVHESGSWLPRGSAP
jgi:hypothetical protein